MSILDRLSDALKKLLNPQPENPTEDGEHPLEYPEPMMNGLAIAHVVLTIKLLHRRLGARDPIPMTYALGSALRRVENEVLVAKRIQDQCLGTAEGERMVRLVLNDWFRRLQQSLHRVVEMDLEHDEDMHLVTAFLVLEQARLPTLILKEPVNGHRIVVHAR